MKVMVLIESDIMRPARVRSKQRHERKKDATDLKELALGVADRACGVDDEHGRDCGAADNAPLDTMAQGACRADRPQTKLLGLPSDI